MTAEIIGVTASAILTVILAGVGVEMVNSPPATSKQKRTYRSVFLVAGTALVIVNLWLSAHNETARQLAERKAGQDRLQDTGQLQYVRGQLDVISSVLSRFAGSLEQLAQHPNSTAPDFSGMAKALASIAREASKATTFQAQPPTQQPSVVQQSISAPTPYAKLSNPELHMTVDKFIAKMKPYYDDQQAREQALYMPPRQMESWTQERVKSYETQHKKDVEKFKADINSYYSQNFQVEAVDLMNEMLIRLKISPPQPEPSLLHGGKADGADPVKAVSVYLENLSRLLSYF